MEIFGNYLRDSMGGDCFDGEAIKLAFEEPVIFTPFIYEMSHGEMLYNEVKTWEEVTKALEDKLEEYNETNVVMPLVLFKMAMSHICKIIRILFMPGGNALLVGVGGNGK